MDLETIRRICLARHLYELGLSSLRSSNDLQLFAAANLFQDAVEAFLIAIGDHVGAVIDQNTKFDKYFVAINERIAPKELPFRLKLLSLNRIRVDSKHYGIQPARIECDGLAISVREFFDEVSSSVLGVTFSTVSAIDLLEDGETKQALLEAKAALESSDHATCAISCRKAIYLEVEHRFNIADFKDQEAKGFFGPFSDAPFFARNKDYIEKYVFDPTNYIVFDHGRLDQELLKQGVDTTAFWNIWRLTPAVYQTKDDVWIVKHEFNKLDAKLLEDKVDYIFSTTLDIVLSLHAARKAVKWQSHERYTLELAKENVPVYQKADVNSKVVGTTPPGMTRIDTEFYVLGFEGDGPYWHVSHSEDGLFLWGYIHADCVK